MGGLKGTNDSGDTRYQRLKNSADDFNGDLSSKATVKPSVSWGVRVVKKILSFLFFWRKNEIASLPKKIISTRIVSTEIKQKLEQKSEQTLPKTHTYVYDVVDTEDSDLSAATATHSEDSIIQAKDLPVSSTVIDEKVPLTEQVIDDAIARSQPETSGALCAQETTDSLHETAEQLSVQEKVADDLQSEVLLSVQQTNSLHPKVNATVTVDESSNPTDSHLSIHESPTEQIATQLPLAMLDAAKLIPVNELFDFKTLPDQVKKYAQTLPDTPENRCEHLKDPRLVELLYWMQFVTVKAADNIEENQDIIKVLPYMQTLQKMTISGNYLSFTEEQYQQHCKVCNTFLQKILRKYKPKQNILSPILLGLATLFQHDINFKPFESTSRQSLEKRFPVSSSSKKSEASHSRKRPINFATIQRGHKKMDQSSKKK